MINEAVTHDRIRSIARKRILQTATSMGMLAASLITLSGELRAQTAASAFTTGYRYDQARNLVGAISPDPDGAGSIKYAAVRNTYDANGRLTQTDYGELANWQAESVLPQNWTGFTIFRSVVSEYDLSGRKTKERVVVSGATQLVTQTNYNSDNSVNCVAVRMNSATFSALPSDACALGTQGSFGPDRITRTFYYGGKIQKIQKAYGTALQQDYVTYSFTPNGQIANVTDANGALAQYAYDGFDRMTRWYFPSKTTAGVANMADYEEYSYDANDNRTSLRKRSGQIIGYSYDALDRITVKDIPGGTTADVYYGYDLRGLQQYARFGSTSGLGLTTVFDSAGRPTSSSNNMSGTTWTLGYQWDADGNRTRVTHPDGNYVSYEYDGLDRSSAVKENGTVTLASIAYNAKGERTGQSTGVSSQSYGFDNLSRLTSLTIDPVGTAGDLTIGLSYSPASQIASRTRSNDSYVYGADSDVTRYYMANGLNQYVTVAGVGFCHDANGNLTADGSFAYKYDVENRLVEKRSQVNSDCNSLAYSGTLQATLRYDPAGRLFETSGTGAARFLIDGDAMVAEYHSNGTLLRRYAHGANPKVDDPLAWYEGATVQASSRRFLQGDQQGSVSAVLDNAGNLIRTFRFDDYGIPQPSDGAWLTGTNGARFLYTGQAWLSDIGLYYYKARMYSPTLGRFLQADPIGYEDQMNLYAYVGNDPFNRTDPSGNETKYIYNDRIVISQTITVSPELAAQMPAEDIVSSANSNLSGSMSNGTPVEVRVSVVDAETAPRSGPDKPIALTVNNKLNDYSDKGSERSHINAINGRSVQIGPTANGSTPKTAAHEIGHGLGGKDQYDKNGPLPGKEDSIMSDLKGPANSSSIDQMVKGADRVIDCRNGRSTAGC